MISANISHNNASLELSFFDEDDDDQETSQDLDAEEISELVVSGTDWTTGTILDQLVRENIRLNPRFQRRDAWDITRKSRFIESLILGLPVPQIVLAMSQTERGKYLVLDGKQRLLTILQFYGKSETSNNSFSLRGLQLRPDLNKLKYDDLTKNILNSSDISALDNQTIRTILIRNWKSEKLLYQIFLRLNVESTPLSPQELRQALHPGPFSNFVDDKSISSVALRKILRSNTPDYRMRDVEILIRHIGFHYFMPSYRGNLKEFLDDTCEKLNKNWDSEEERLEDVLDAFEKAVEVGINIFGENHFSKVWLSSTNKYQTRFNKAIFDVVSFYFSDQKIREVAMKKGEKVENAFKDLCASHPEFVNSVQRTSKNMQETSTRFSLWGDYLSKALDLEFNVPKLSDNNRIVFNGLW